MQNSFHIKKDDKFFSKLLSKESSNGNPSFRVYYGDVTSSVPFTWETRPGTPKHTFSDVSLPPLTPPPAYNLIRVPKKPTKNHSRSELFSTLLRRISIKKKTHVPISPSCSSSLSSLSSWSSSYSSFSAVAMEASSHPSFRGHRRAFSSFGSSEGGAGGNENQEMSGEPYSSRFCFGFKKG